MAWLLLILQPYLLPLQTYSVCSSHLAAYKRTYLLVCPPGISSPTASSVNSSSASSSTASTLPNTFDKVSYPTEGRYVSGTACSDGTPGSDAISALESADNTTPMAEGPQKTQVQDAPQLLPTPAANNSAASRAASRSGSVGSNQSRPSSVTQRLGLLADSSLALNSNKHSFRSLLISRRISSIVSSSSKGVGSTCVSPIGSMAVSSQLQEPVTASEGPQGKVPGSSSGSNKVSKHKAGVGQSASSRQQTNVISTLSKLTSSSTATKPRASQISSNSSSKKLQGVKCSVAAEACMVKGHTSKLSSAAAAAGCSPVSSACLTASPSSPAPRRTSTTQPAGNKPLKQAVSKVAPRPAAAAAVGSCCPVIPKRTATVQASPMPRSSSSSSSKGSSSQSTYNTPSSRNGAIGSSKDKAAVTTAATAPTPVTTVPAAAAVAAADAGAAADAAVCVPCISSPGMHERRCLHKLAKHRVIELMLQQEEAGVDYTSSSSSVSSIKETLAAEFSPVVAATALKLVLKYGDAVGRRLPLLGVAGCQCDSSAAAAAAPDAAGAAAYTPREPCPKGSALLQERRNALKLAKQKPAALEWHFMATQRLDAISQELGVNSGC